MNNGVVVFAHNNSEIDYGSMALANSYLINYYLNQPITLVTEESTFNYMSNKNKNKMQIFDKIIYSDKHLDKVSQKTMRDTSYSEKILNWYNCDRIHAFEFSPYDKTLVLDSDYLIFNDKLKYAFDSNESYLMNSSVVPLQRQYNWFISEEKLNINSIKQYWATAFYFEKNDYTNAIFDFAKFVYENYDYYKALYNTSGKAFRNDHLFSIVNHTFSGLLGAEISSLPISYLLTAPDYDELIEIEKNTATFLVVKPKETYDFHLTQIKDTNVHVMNKQSILRNVNKILEIYS